MLAVLCKRRTMLSILKYHSYDLDCYWEGLTLVFLVKNILII